MSDRQLISDFDQALQVLRLRGVPAEFVELFKLFRDETMLNSPVKAAAVRRIVDRIKVDLAKAGIV